MGSDGDAEGDVNRGSVAEEVLVSADAWQRFGALLTPSAPDAQWWLLAADGTLRDADGERDPRRARPAVAWLSNDVFYSGGLAAFTAAVRDAPALRWLQSAAAGTDSALFQGLLERGVRLTTSHITDVPIAEYVLGAVLRHYQQPWQWTQEAQQRHWGHHEFREVAGTTWLVIGLGAIGTAVARRADAFGARVLGVRRTPSGHEPVETLLTPDRVLEAVPEADVVVLAAAATPRTRHLVDDTFLSRMRPGSVLVNVARGSLVDEHALATALAHGVPEHAILDVFADEPLPADSPWWSHPAVTVTPHNSGGGLGRFRRAAEVFADNLRRYRADEPLRHEVADTELAGPSAPGWHVEARG